MREVHVIHHTLHGDVTSEYSISNLDAALELFKKLVESGERATISTFG